MVSSSPSRGNVHTLYFFGEELTAHTGFVLKLLVPKNHNRQPMRRKRKGNNQSGRNPQFMSAEFSCQGPMPHINSTHTPYNQTYTVSAFQSRNAGTTSTLGATNVGVYFTLGDLSLSSQYAAVFDEYRIKRLECWITPTWVQVPESAPEPAVYCTAIDLDNAASPAGYQQIACKPGSIMSPCFQGHYHRWKPRPSGDVYTGAFNGFAELPNAWIDCSNTNVQYYGLKISFSTTAADFGILLMTRYTVEFRGTAT